VSTAKKWTLIALAAIVLVYSLLAGYAVTQQDIHRLILCSDHGGLKIPFAKNVCRLYLYSFRGTKQDMEDLHAGAGALFVTQGEDLAQRRETLRFLVSRGLDVNRASPVDGLPPLHAAVVLNDPEQVSLLLESGARQDIEDQRFKLKPLALAKHLQTKDPTVNTARSAVIKLLGG
jgi:uncharacterized protein